MNTLFAQKHGREPHLTMFGEMWCVDKVSDDSVVHRTVGALATGIGVVFGQNARNNKLQKINASN
jgi:hypothetical protein